MMSVKTMLLLFLKQVNLINQSGDRNTRSSRFHLSRHHRSMYMQFIDDSVKQNPQASVSSLCKPAQKRNKYLTISTFVAHSDCFSLHCGSSQSSSQKRTTKAGTRLRCLFIQPVFRMPLGMYHSQDVRQKDKEDNQCSFKTFKFPNSVFSIKL